MPNWTYVDSVVINVSDAGICSFGMYSKHYDSDSDIPVLEVMRLNGVETEAECLKDN
jgi:hypothetical protein